MHFGSCDPVALIFDPFHESTLCQWRKHEEMSAIYRASGQTGMQTNGRKSFEQFWILIRISILPQIVVMAVLGGRSPSILKYRENSSATFWVTMFINAGVDKSKWNYMYPALFARRAAASAGAQLMATLSFTSAKTLSSASLMAIQAGY